MDDRTISWPTNSQLPDFPPPTSQSFSQLPTSQSVVSSSVMPVASLKRSRCGSSAGQPISSVSVSSSHTTTGRRHGFSTCLRRLTLLLAGGLLGLASYSTAAWAQDPSDYSASSPWQSSGYSQPSSFMERTNDLSDRIKKLKENSYNTPSLGRFVGNYGYFYDQSNGRFSADQNHNSNFTVNLNDGCGPCVSAFQDSQLENEQATSEETNVSDNGNISRGTSEDSEPLIANGMPVHLMADKVLVTEDSIEASGNASIDVMGSRMLCNHLVLDRTTGRITASGECVLYWNSSFVAADWLTYDPNSQIAVMHNVTGQGRDFSSADSSLEGDLFFWADTLQWTREKMILSEATFTTCDKPADDLDFKFKSKYVEIYPEDKLIASNASVLIHDTHIYTTPTLNISLDNKRRTRSTVIPRIGSNSVDGWFARNSIDYVFDNNNYGEILLDYYSKTGIGTGIRHYYTIGNKGNGSLYYYRLNGDKISSRYDLSSSIFYQFDDETKASWDFSSNRSETPGFTNEGRINSLFNFQHIDEKNDLRFSHNYNTKGSENRNTTWRLYYDLQLTPELSTTWKAELSTIATSYRTAQRFHYYGGLRHTGELFDSELYMENTTGDTNYCLNRNPEFTLRSHPIFIGDVPVFASVGLGHVTEMPSNYSTNRCDLRIQIPDQSFEYGSGRFLAGAGFRQLFYGNGQNMYSLAARLGWLQELGDVGTLRLDYNWLSPQGETPLQYDLTHGYENITGGIEFFKDDVFNFAVVSGYNFKTDKFHNVTPRLLFRPSEKFLLGAGAGYDPMSRRWRNLDTNLRFHLTPELAVSHWSVYDLVNNRFTYQDYQLDYEAHDWITSLVYRSVQNELYFQFSLKAFPKPPVTIGPNQANEIVPKNRRNAFVQ